MAELKTKKNKSSVSEFLNKNCDSNRLKECQKISKMMKDVTKSNPKMWGSSIIGFGDYHYKYKSGREGDWFVMGFSPRKQALSIYLTCDLDKYEKELKKLGIFKRGRGCLYVKKLEDVDLKVLKKLMIMSNKEIDKYGH